MSRRAAGFLLPIAALGTTGAHCCFVAGTRVSTPQGRRRIEELVVGDTVWSLDTDTRTLRPQRVVAVMAAQGQRLARLRVADRVIEGVTTEHPFYDPERGRWVRAVDLRRGQPVVVLTGDEPLPGTVSRIEWRDEPARLFNITVEGLHNYFAEGVLVHNKRYAVYHSGPVFDTSVLVTPSPLVPGSARPQGQAEAMPRPVAIAQLRDDCDLSTVEVGFSNELHQPLPFDLGFSGAHILVRPGEPVQPDRTYSVQVSAVCDEQEAHEAWSYETGSLGSPLDVPVAGHTYTIDLGTARLLQPFEPPHLLAERLDGHVELRIDAWSETQASLTIGGLATLPTQDCVYQDPIAATTDGPYFQAGSGSLRVEVMPYGPMRFDLSEISGSVVSDGTAIRGITLVGVLDTRPLSDLGNGGDFCGDTGACTPCPDGAVACIDLWIDSLDATVTEQPTPACPQE